MSSREKENLIADWLEEHKEEVVRTADYIFRHPETAYKEELSSAYLASFLEENGFRVEKKTAGIDTAFTAVWGEGRPVIGFLAEYDALPELGHACGHNLLGTGAAAAACALKAYMKKVGAACHRLSGRVRRTAGAGARLRPQSAGYRSGGSGLRPEGVHEEGGGGRDLAGLRLSRGGDYVRKDRHE